MSYKSYGQVSSFGLRAAIRHFSNTKIEKSLCRERQEYLVKGEVITKRRIYIYDLALSFM
jgi:hypothetical protein